MRWIPSNFNADFHQPLTSSLENRTWRKRSSDRGIVSGESRREFFCLNTVVVNDVIIDFEALAIVIRSERYLLNIESFWITVVLLFAEGAEVSTKSLGLFLGHADKPNIVDMVGRKIRQVKSTSFYLNSGMMLTSTAKSCCLVVKQDGRAGEHDRV